MAGGLDSMGIRRIEAGILDYGTDMNRTNNPFEVGLGSFVDLNKAQFIGKDRLSTMSRKTKLFGIKTSTAIPFAGLEIIENNKVVGYTLSEFIEAMHESDFFQPFTQGELIVETREQYSSSLMEAYDEERFGY